MMRMRYLGQFAIAGLLFATGCTTSVASNGDSHPTEVVTIAEAGPCAGNPELAADPCAGADPCAAAPAEAEVAEAAPADHDYFVGGNGLAIHGTDPVAYFTEGAAVTGSPEYTYDWGNATWQFASAENRDLFAANPQQYAPQYGGFCAWAVSQGYTASIDPNAWRIVEGRLYLNYSPGVQRQWEQDIPGNISRADANWPGLSTGS
jgi:YHS domain-containing protein